VNAPPYAEAYDARYYARGCGEPYRRDNVWLGFFRRVADRVVEGIGPGSVLDAGCAMGFLVETLRERGVEAWGVDVSAYAIGEAHPSIQAFVRVGTITEPFGRRYDLAVCIEVVEHLPPDEAPAAVANLCAHADDILFSSSPADHRELTHLGVRPPEHWAELFARHGFYRDVDFDASFLTPWAARFRKGLARAAEPAFARVAAAYERKLWHLAEENEGRRAVAIEQQGELMAKDRELEALRERVATLEADRVALEVRSHGQRDEIAGLTRQVNAWRARWHAVEVSPGWAQAQRLQRARARFLPPGSLAERAFLTFNGWSHLVLAHGLGFFARHLARETRARAGYWRREWSRRRSPGRVDWLAVPSIPAPAPIPERTAAVDIVVCVHDALDDVRRCLSSIERHTPPPFRLILVDDGSGAETAAWLEAYARDHPATVRLRREAAGGYTVAANAGLARSLASAGTAGDAPPDFVVLLNSDTVVTPAWLERLVGCAASDERIGLVGPLSNCASWQSIPDVDAGGDWADNPLPADLSADDMAQLVARDSARLYPRLPFLNGFCLLVRRAVLEQVGLFDEAAFGEGYGEENDYALRARAAGWALALADDAYVYHAQSRSYSHDRRLALAERAGRALAAKHGEHEIAAGVAFLRDDRVLRGVRARARHLADRDRIIRGGRDRFAGRRVLVVLPVSAAGGGASVAMFELRAMREMGVEVALFNLEKYRPYFEQAYPDLDIPVLYGQPEDLVMLAPAWDALVATVYASVEWLELVARGPGGAGTVFGYLIQDLEAYFFPPGSDRFHAALESYRRLPELRCFTLTPWNAAELDRLVGVAPEVVTPGYDADLFRPRPRAGADWPARPLRVAAMVRPSTPFRAPRLTMEVLREITRRHGPRVEAWIFGVSPEDEGYADLPRDFPFKLAGKLGPRQMPALLNEVDVFCDFSTYQALGMTAMEAMATGCAVIVTRHGGPDVFGRHEDNCLMVDTHDREACIAALDRLVVEEGLRRHLGRAGIHDICAFYPERAAYKMLEVLFGPEIDAAARDA